MIRIVALLALFVMTSAIDCTPHPTPPPVNPVGIDGGPTATCAAVCEHGQHLGCSWAQPTPAGHSCLEVCRNASDPSGPVFWDLACRAATPTCSVGACQ